MEEAYPRGQELLNFYRNKTNKMKALLLGDRDIYDTVFKKQKNGKHKIQDSSYRGQKG